MRLQLISIHENIDVAGQRLLGILWCKFNDTTFWNSSLDERVGPLLCHGIIWRNDNGGLFVFCILCFCDGVSQTGGADGLDRRPSIFLDYCPETWYHARLVVRSKVAVPCRPRQTPIHHRLGHEHKPY